MRKDVTTLGKFSLNFNNTPLSVVSASSENQGNNANETFANSFYKALTQFVTMVSQQPFEYSKRVLDRMKCLSLKIEPQVRFFNQQLEPVESDSM